MIRTASVHIDRIDGIYSGVARCYRLSPPFPDPQTGEEYEYIAIVVQPGYRDQQLPEVHAYAAHPNGGAKGPSMKRLPGSTVLYGDSSDPNYLEGAYAYALLTLDVKEVVT